MSRPGWQRGCALLCAAAVLGLVVACPAAVFGVRRGAIAPRQFNQACGVFRLEGYRTWNANCPPYTGCDPTLHESFVVWLIGPPRNGEPLGASYRLLALPIEH